MPPDWFIMCCSFVVPSLWRAVQGGAHGSRVHGATIDSGPARLDDGHPFATTFAIRAPMAASSDASPYRDSPGITVRQPGALPVWHTPLVGRERDLERLVTL